MRIWLVLDDQPIRFKLWAEVWEPWAAKRILGCNEAGNPVVPDSVQGQDNDGQKVEILPVATAERAIFLLGCLQRGDYFSRSFRSESPKTIDLSLSLDHDLGTEKTGMDVVDYLCTNKMRIVEIVVHSCNFSRAQEMVARLRDAGYKAKGCPLL